MITVEWANEAKTVVRWRFINTWTWDDFYAAQKEVDAMIDTVDGIVDGIILTSASQNLPSGALPHLRKITIQRHKRYGLSYVVGSGVYLTTVLNILAKVVREETIRFVGTEVEAFAHIAQAQQKRNDQHSSVA